MNKLIVYLKICQRYTLGEINLNCNQKAELSKFLQDLEAQEYKQTPWWFTVSSIVKKYLKYLHNSRQEQNRLQVMSDQQRKNELIKDAGDIERILVSQPRALWI